MPNIANFTLWGPGYFCASVNIVELCSVPRNLAGSPPPGLFPSFRNHCPRLPSGQCSHRCFIYPLRFFWLASLMGQMVKNLPAMRETRVWSLGQEEPLEKEMATHCSILAWRIPWTKEPAGLQKSMGLQRVRHNWAANTFTFEHTAKETINKMKRQSTKWEKILQIIYLMGGLISKKYTEFIQLLKVQFKNG